MQKNDILRVRIEEINNLGAGVGHLPDGRVVFVRGALTGERVRATVIKVASSFLVARLDAVLSPSPYRLPDDAPDCGASENCGGCIYRHISYECINHNNVTGWYMNDGALYLYTKTDDHEFDGINFILNDIYAINNVCHCLEAM